jgi:hypothetical protein
VLGDRLLQICESFEDDQRCWLAVSALKFATQSLIAPHAMRAKQSQLSALHVRAKKTTISCSLTGFCFCSLTTAR